ncbi:Putative K+ transporter with a NAD-binding domain [Modestobacter italicus]|uniref:K+ transporter with a NAD-binding domain n=1 Tax=Modestobacter italicus (strain DSM 44449 / CECT 9708 / BC 501) TaxID=2732864 RepID=I4EWC4_MODI5|nr:NAD-binding protein [Modestobacter marinus]CCH87687.1 Putative K+ transporter with a NAD-binding domain [Modestobacter marinus]
MTSTSGDGRRPAMGERHLPGKRPVPAGVVSGVQASAPIFLVLRRMRAPLITLVLIFAVSVLGLSLITGVDDAGRPYRMSIFDSFYVMSYTATTIGFGELPYPFTAAQRLWVTGTIYLSVIGWAYAISALLTLLQDRAFRAALALQHFSRKVSRLREPFLLIVGYGQTGELLGRSFDELGRRFTVVDLQDARIDALELDTLRADVPGLAGDARNPHDLQVAGLTHPCCEAVLALTDDDEANLAVTMTAALLRPELTVVTRTTSAVVAERMSAFGSPTVINPFDRFGDHLRLALHSPAAYQLMTWLESGPGAELPPRRSAPAPGRWVVAGYGRFGQHFAADLRAEGLEVTVIEPQPGEDPPPDPLLHLVVGDESDPAVMAASDLPGAVGFVAGTDNDTTNLSLVAAARRVNPDLFVAARQNQPTSAALFAAMDVDALLVPTEVIAHEVYARLSTPLLWRFVRELAGQDDAWAAGLIDQLRGECGDRLGALFKVRLNATEAPSLGPWLAEGSLVLGDLLRSPDDREERLPAVPVLLLRDGQSVLAPADDLVLRADDELLLAGRPISRRALEKTLMVDAVPAYLVTGRRVPSGWLWRRLTGYRPAPR